MLLTAEIRLAFSFKLGKAWMALGIRSGQDRADVQVFGCFYQGAENAAHPRQHRAERDDLIGTYLYDILFFSY